MSFQVVQTRNADNQLALCWLTCQDRKGVTSAQHQMERLLTRDPKGSGQEISEGLWRTEVSPLVAYYEIDDTNKEVTITSYALLP